MRERGEIIELVPAVAPRPDFHECIVSSYHRGAADWQLTADDAVASSFVPPGTAALRDFSYIAPMIPAFLPDGCVGCMECVTACPDTAILAKVIGQPDLEGSWRE